MLYESLENLILDAQSWYEKNVIAKNMRERDRHLKQRRQESWRAARGSVAVLSALFCLPWLMRAKVLLPNWPMFIWYAIGAIACVFAVNYVFKVRAALQSRRAHGEKAATLSKAAQPVTDALAIQRYLLDEALVLREEHLTLSDEALGCIDQIARLGKKLTTHGAREDARLGKLVDAIEQHAYGNDSAKYEALRSVGLVLHNRVHDLRFELSKATSYCDLTEVIRVRFEAIGTLAEAAQLANGPLRDQYASVTQMLASVHMARLKGLLGIA